MSANCLKIPKCAFISSVVLAFFVDVKSINWAFTYGGFVSVSEGGLMVPLYFISSIGVLYCMLISHKYSSNISIVNKGLFITLFLVLFYVVTLWFVGTPETSISMFLIMTIIAFFTPQHLVIDARIFLKTTMLLPCFAVLRIDRIFLSTVDWDMRLSMDVTYGFLIPIMASLFFFVFYFNRESKFRKCISSIGIICNSIFFLKMLQFGSRGPLLCVFCAFVFIYICEWRLGKITINKNRLRLLMIWAVIILIGGITLLSSFSHNLQNLGFNIYALNKILELNQEGDISNGRSYLNDMTWSYIVDSPFWGHGFDRYNAITKMLYPHNFVLQLLFDGGIILLLIVLVPVFNNIKKYWKSCSQESYVFMSMLFFASVPGALFSQNLWQIVVLWVCFGAIIQSNLLESNINGYYEY